jgi:transposase-like protein
MGYDRRELSRRNSVMIDFKGSHFERDVILWGVRWYVAYPMSYRQLEEMMEERGVEVDHSTLNRWVVKYAPLLEKQFRARKRSIGSSWRLDETYVTVKGCWKYLYRAVDKAGATVDFLLTAKRDCKAALRFLRKAIGQHGEPEKIKLCRIAALSRAHFSRGSGEASDATDAEFQTISIGRSDAFRHRVDAHDPKGAAANDRRIASTAAIPLPCRVSDVIFTHPSRLQTVFATQPLVPGAAVEVAPTRCSRWTSR